MSKVIAFIFSFLLACTALANAAFQDPPQAFQIILEHTGERQANIPNSAVLEILETKFQESKSVFSGGDLEMNTRWACREFFGEAKGSTDFRFRSIRFEEHSTGIIEDVLNRDFRFYTYSRLKLSSQSSYKKGSEQEVRVDAKGNLRIKNVYADGKVESYTVCLRKNKN